MSTYRELKQANPKFPILVREAETAQAKLIARFGETAHPKRHCRAACCMHVFLARPHQLRGLDMRFNSQILEWRRA